MNELLKELLKMENPDAAAILAKALIEKYKTAAYSMLEDFHEIYKDYANNKEYFKTVATVKKNQYDAYLEAGFSEEQATAFLINDNLKLMNNIKNYESKQKK